MYNHFLIGGFPWKKLKILLFVMCLFKVLHSNTHNKIDPYLSDKFLSLSNQAAS
jgi:hypothetical protein